MTRLITALEGDLKGVVEGEIRGAESAVTRGVDRATVSLKEELRGQVVAAGLGGRLARTWRSRIYPEGMENAGIVWSKAPHIVRAFDEGVVIRARRGLCLAIPTPSAPKRGVGRKRIHRSPGRRTGWARCVWCRVAMVVCWWLTTLRHRSAAKPAPFAASARLRYPERKGIFHGGNL